MTSPTAPPRLIPWPSLLLGLLAPLGLLAGPGASPAQAEVVHLRDGRVLTGRVTQEGDEVVIHRKLGALRVRSTEVLRIEEEPRTRRLRTLRVQLAKGTAEERYRFGALARELGFPAEARRAFLSVLRLDLDHAGARAALGYLRHEGRWITLSDKRRLEGLVEHEGQWVTPEQKATRVEAARAALAKKRAAYRAKRNARKAATLAKKRARDAARREALQERAERREEAALVRAQERALAQVASRYGQYRPERYSVLRGGYGYTGYRYPGSLGWGTGGCRGPVILTRPLVGGRYARRGRGVYYGRRSGVSSSGYYNGGKWGVRWRIGY